MSELLLKFETETGKKSRRIAHFQSATVYRDFLKKRKSSLSKFCSMNITTKLTQCWILNFTIELHLSFFSFIIFQHRSRDEDLPVTLVMKFFYLYHYDDVLTVIEVMKVFTLSQWSDGTNRTVFIIMNHTATRYLYRNTLFVKNNICLIIADYFTSFSTSPRSDAFMTFNTTISEWPNSLLLKRPL